MWLKEPQILNEKKETKNYLHKYIFIDTPWKWVMNPHKNIEANALLRKIKADQKNSKD
jgi:hypothetical protein